MNMRKVPILYSLIGTIIGASFFTLPYVFDKQNLILASSLFLLISLLSMYTNYIYSKIIINTHSQHQLPGYTEIYLGRKYKTLVSVMTLLGALGSNLAYIIIIISFVNTIFQNQFNEKLIALIFVILFGLPIFSRNLFNKSERYLTSLLIILLLSLTAILLWQTNNYSSLIILTSNKIQPFTIPLLLGVTLAANTGFGILPELKKTLSTSNLKLTTIINSLIPIILYIGFIIAVLLNSHTVSENGLSGLVLSNPLIVLGALVGILAVTTSYQSLSVVSIDTLVEDFNCSRLISILIVIFIPLALFAVGVNQLVLVIGTVGGLFTAFSHLIIHLIYKIKFGHTFIFELFSYILAIMIIIEIIRLVFKML